MYSSLNLASFFIDYEQKNKLSLSDITKLIYIANGWSMAISDKLIINEQFLISPFGINLASLSSLVRLYGNEPIKQKFSVLPKNHKITVGLYLPLFYEQYNSYPPIDTETLEVLTEVEKKYANLDREHLHSICNGKNSAYMRTLLEVEAEYSLPIFNYAIPFTYIKEEYEALKKKVLEDQQG